MQGVYCLRCAHYKLGMTCPAFPDGIPAEIVAGLEPHDSVREDQEGELTFEPVEPEESEGG